MTNWIKTLKLFFPHHHRYLHNTLGSWTDNNKEGWIFFIQLANSYSIELQTIGPYFKSKGKMRKYKNITNLKDSIGIAPTYQQQRVEQQCTNRIQLVY